MSAIEGNESEVQRLLMNGADLNATDENGNSALLVAAGKGNLYKFKVKDNSIINLNIVQVPRVWSNC